MPDRYGFDTLGDKRRCIHCEEGGYAWEWDEKARARHFARHERARQLAARARQDELRREAKRRLREINRLRREARS